MSIENKLREMKGKSFLVNGIEHTIANYQIDDDKVVIATDKRFFTATVDEANKLLDGFLKISEEKYIVPTKSELFYQNVPPILQILRENIQRVQEDAEYIEQAKTVNEMVKSAIMLSRTLVEAERLKRMM